MISMRFFTEQESKRCFSEYKCHANVKWWVSLLE